MPRPHITLVVTSGLMAGIWYSGATAPVQQSSPTSADELANMAQTFAKTASADYYEAYEQAYDRKDWDPVHQFDPHRAPKAKKYGPKPPIRKQKR